MFSSRNPYTQHGDVLEAEPQDGPSRAVLVEEIRNRAKAAFANKDFPAAEALYSKVIKLEPSATFHSNRSAVRINLGRFDSALFDAEEAIRIDPSYSKAYYRKGQACMGLGGTHVMEALEAFKFGFRLEPDNKVWSTQIQKAEEAVKSAESSKQFSKTEALKSVASETKKSVSPQEIEAADSEIIFDANEKNGYRGYKKTADGRTTTFFHRDLSEQEKQLIGDIAPRRIEASVVDAEATRRCEIGSAWNSAGTWEERNVTDWSKNRLRSLLEEIDIDILDGHLGISNVSEISGDASVSFSRGKKRLLFDFAIKICWEGVFSCGKVKGSIEIAEMSYDCCGSYEMTVTVDSLSAPAAKHIIDDYVRNDEKGLQPQIKMKLNKYIAELNAK